MTKQTIDVMERLNRFAKKYGIALLTESATGFRPCVGFAKTITSKSYVAHNPLNMTTFAVVTGFEDDRLQPPDHVNAYGDHPALVVLIDEDADKPEALGQLDEWVANLESQGELEVVQYNTGANGIQARLSGSTGWAIRFKR